MADPVRLEQVRALDDQTALAILSYVTEDLKSRVPEDWDGPAGEDEAREAIAGLLRTAGPDPGVEPATVVPDDAANAAAARQVLAIMLDDPDVAAVVMELLDNPPQDDQLSVELAIAAAVILGALVTWLQTKVRLRISRTGGQTEFEFELRKDAADPSTIKDVAHRPWRSGPDDPAGVGSGQRRNGADETGS